MFRKNCIIIVLFFAATSVFGQKFKLGILVDPTITWLKSDISDITRDKARMGIDLGMSVDYFFAQNYAFATGISLFNMGGTLKYDKAITLHTKDGDIPLDPFGNGKVKYKIQYVKLPAGLKFKTHEIGRITYSANLGFDPMIRVSTRANYDDEKNIKATKATKMFNLGWHFGTGAQYSLGGNTSLFAGLTFLNTFFDITKHSKDKITSNNLSFQIGVIF